MALRYYCDGLRHLVCVPYSVENLHRMAEILGIKRCWFHPSKGHPHYDIPKRRIDEIRKRCKVVPGRVILRIIKEGLEMGYCISQIESKFDLPKAHFEEALKAIQGLHGQETIKDSFGEHFSWVDENFFEINDLVEMLKEWRWSVGLGLDGSIGSIQFTGEKMGDDGIMFRAIAPFVGAGSYIEMQGEDGARWRWTFDGKICKQVWGHLTWEDDGSYR